MFIMSDYTQKTSELARMFNVSQQTIRTWADEFEEFLSPTATPGHGRQRIFSRDDIEVLTLVAQQRAMGLQTEDIRAALQNGQRIELADTVTSSPVPVDFRSRLLALQDKVTDLERQLTDAQAALLRKSGEAEALERQLERAQQEIKKLNREIGRLGGE
jgi:DNA-binding transcriptional MerR regulator